MKFPLLTTLSVLSISHNINGFFGNWCWFVFGIHVAIIKTPQSLVEFSYGIKKHSFIYMYKHFQKQLGFIWHHPLKQDFMLWKTLADIEVFYVG